jgi:hypothetical protein
MHYGQRYDIRDVLLDHVTIAGRTVELRLVESQCAECGAEFSFWMTDQTIERGWFNRRCNAHKRPGKRVRRF